MVCCHVGSVPELGKPAHSPCAHAAKGCAIHGSASRPMVCDSFQCSWLRGAGLPEDRPDISKVMCSANKLNGGNWVFVIELAADAALTTGRAIVERLTTLSSTPVILVDHGAVPPDDKGNRVVVKSQLEKRADRIRGKFLGYLDDERAMSIYELVVG